MSSYPEQYERLQSLSAKLHREIPGAMSGFGQLHQKALTDGALNRKTKELVALGISIAARCEGCVAYHVHDSLKAGATRPEVLEVIGVGIMMGGGPGLIYACEALDALNQFQGESQQG
jgi:AhpD family alkylhydroperoxidase